jgi:hypothetical protein
VSPTESQFSLGFGNTIAATEPEALPDPGPVTVQRARVPQYQRCVPGPAGVVDGSVVDLETPWHGPNVAVPNVHRD